MDGPRSLDCQNRGSCRRQPCAVNGLTPGGGEALLEGFLGPRKRPKEWQDWRCTDWSLELRSEDQRWAHPEPRRVPEAVVRGDLVTVCVRQPQHSPASTCSPALPSSLGSGMRALSSACSRKKELGHLAVPEVRAVRARAGAGPVLCISCGCCDKHRKRRGLTNTNFS